MLEKKYFEKFNGNTGVPVDINLKSKLPTKIPLDYFNFISLYNGGEGFIGEEYLKLYKIEELLHINEDYSVDEFAPDIFIIGTNGGGEAIAFDFRYENPKYILIPFIFDYNDVIELGNNINDFFARIYKKGYFL